MPGEKILCRPCRLVAPAFERAVAHGLYTGRMRSMLHLLKYDGLEPMAGRLGELIAAQVAAIENLPGRMLVVPVPLFAGRRKKRGFNQAELLARATKAAMRRIRPDWVGELAGRALQRQRATESQAGLSLHERRRNLRGAFFVPDAALVAGQHVLLIDDIYTTGATARACSQVLKKAGAASVWVATAARAQRHEVKFSSAETVPGTKVELPMHMDIALWDGGSALQ